MDGKQRFSLRISIGGALIGAILLTSLFLGGSSLAMWRDSARRDLESRMRELAGTAVLLIDADAHKGLRAESDMDGEAYASLRAKLQKVRAASPDIRFLYTYRLGSGESKPRFVLDTGTPGTDFSPLGQVYETMTATLAASFAPPYEVRVEPAFFTDRWGTWLSAYAPIIDASGRLEGVLGMDMDAGSIAADEARLVLLMVGLTLAIVVVMGLGSLVLARRIARPLLALSKEMGEIRELNLDADEGIKSAISEVALMSGAVENMKMGLRSFRKYVPTDLVAQLIGMQKEASLGTTKQDLTIFFCDLENSTTAGEILSSEDLNRLMTGYFQAVTRILRAHGATIDKFIGDAVMAFWNAPLPVLDHAYLGAKASLEVHLELDRLLDEWRSRGLPPLATRIGLNSGSVLVGNVGHEERLSYTAMGDAVNLASRLESLNKYYGTRILVGEETLKGIGGRLPSRPVDRVAVKGKSKGSLISEIAEETPTWWTSYGAAWSAYESRDWKGALELFERVERPDGIADGPSKALAARCRRFVEQGAPADWTGTWFMQEK